jgi:DNA-binding transcriptional ArsR family regulator
MEKLLSEVAARLERLEKALGPGGEALAVAAVLVSVLGMSSIEAVHASLRLAELFKRYGHLDPVSRAVLQALSHGRWVTVSELTRLVRAIRGTASRRIVRERVKELESIGLVEVRRERRRTLVRMKREEQLQHGDG